MTKICKGCKITKSIDVFYASGKYKQSYCITCHKANVVKRLAISNNKATQQMQASRWRATKANRLPRWHSLLENQYLKFFEEAEALTNSTGVLHEVDHIIPLKHPLVCGLHVPWNLQIITDAENIVKMASWDGTYNNDTWKTRFLKTLTILNNKYLKK